MDPNYKRNLINQYLALTDDITKTKRKIKTMNDYLDCQNEQLKKYEKEIFKIILEDNNIDKC